VPSRTSTIVQPGIVAGLVSGGLVKGTSYEIAVDNSLTQEVMRGNPPPLI